MENLKNFMSGIKSQPTTTPVPIHRSLMKIPQNVPEIPKESTSMVQNVPKGFYSGSFGGSGRPGTSRGEDGEGGTKRKLPESVMRVRKLIKEHNEVHEGAPGQKWRLAPKDKEAESSGSAKRPPTMKIMTGNIAQILKIQKEHPDELFLYEIYANVLCVKEGKYSCEKLLLLRNDDGPVLQALFYETDRKLPVVEGQLVRCVGNFNHKTRFVVHEISPTDEAFVRLGGRLHAICHFTINKN